MLRASMRSLMGRKLRLLFSAFAIVLGVSFVVGSLIFTDTLARAFDSITVGSVGQVVVRPAKDPGADGQAQSRAPSLPGSLAARLEAVDGVARADGNVGVSDAFIVGKDGKIIATQGPPALAFNTSEATALSGDEPLTVVSGREPTRSGEVALDAASATKAGYVLGDPVRLITSGARPVVTSTLVGTVRFTGGGLVGATVAEFDTATAQALFAGGKDVFDDYWVTLADGADPSVVRDRIATVLPAGLEVVTGQVVADEAADGITEAVSFITTFLLVFAGISLVVGSFLIVNTFSILVAQRSRELALLRALGASRRQVGRSVLVEAVVVGIVGSTLGLGLGWLMAVGIRALFATFGLDLTASSLVFAPRTVGAAYLIGVVVTAVAAYLPARRASRIAPVAAMSDDVAMPEQTLRRRLWLGLAMIVIGGSALATGLFADIANRVGFVGVGALLVLLGVAATSPVVGRPVIAVVGGFYRRVFGTVGQLAALNAVRAPRRTAATASALMIGLTLVATMAVVGQSVKTSLDAVIREAASVDYLITSPVGAPISPDVATAAGRVPGVEAVTRLRVTPATIGGTESVLGGFDPGQPPVLKRTVVQGSEADVHGFALMVEQAEASQRGLAVGEPVPVRIGGVTRDFRVAAIYTQPKGVGTAYAAAISTLVESGVPDQDFGVGVIRERGADATAVKRALDSAVADVPTVTVQDKGEYAESQRAQIDQLLGLIYALLALAIVIAVLGIVNTLALSVIERTREIGLLRAVGLGRRQLRRMIRLESTVIALLGAVLGIGLGIVFGIALQQALAGEGIDRLDIPVLQLVAFLVVAVGVGVAAALGPALRASRLDVLRAITTE